jgi:glycosyltransferase involved in cell wall biosynthesis
VPEIIEDGLTGFIVDSLDAAVAAVPLAKQLDRVAIRRRFEQRFTSERMARDYLRIYDQVLSARAFGTRTTRGVTQAAD